MELFQSEECKQSSTTIQNLGQQIASNNLVINQIMQHLGKEDLLRFSFVNKTWMKYARESLKKRHKCQIILKDHPCRELLQLNADLENQDNIFYNGIKHNAGLTLSSPDHREQCLWASKKPVQIGDELRRMYANILKSIHVEYFEFVLCIPSIFSCPFYHLIPIILEENRQVMKEYRTPGLCHINVRWTSYLKQNIFPNLQTLQAEDIPDADIVRTIPNVRKVIRYQMRYNDGPNLPPPGGTISHLYTNVIMVDSGHPLFDMEQPPRWESIKIHLNTWVDSFFERFLWASKSLCFTLNNLECDLSLLADIIAIPNMPQFFALKTISTGTNKKDSRDSYLLMQGINWDCFAPNLEEFSLGEGFLVSFDRHMTSQIGSLHPDQQFQSSSTRDLENYTSLDVANIFPNIAVLRLSERNLDQIFHENPVFLCMEDLHVHLHDTGEERSLDFLLDVHEDELEDIGKIGFQDSQQLCFVPSQRSLLNRKGLKRIFITRNGGKNISKQIMSVGAASLICSKMPGLSLRLSYAGLVQQDFEIEHLRPYAVGRRLLWGSYETKYQIDFGYQDNCIL